MLVELNCNRRATRWLGATVTNIPAGQEQGLNIGLYCNMPASLGKLLQKNCLFFSDMYAGPVKQSHTCVTVNMSADRLSMGLMIVNL